MFTTEGPVVTGSITDVVLLLGFIALTLVLTIWALVSFFRALSEVQRFPVWKAVASAAIPFLVLVGVGVGIALLVY